MENDKKSGTMCMVIRRINIKKYGKGERKKGGLEDYEKYRGAWTNLGSRKGRIKEEELFLLYFWGIRRIFVRL